MSIQPPAKASRPEPQIPGVAEDGGADVLRLQEDRVQGLDPFQAPNGRSGFNRAGVDQEWSQTALRTRLILDVGAAGEHEGGTDTDVHPPVPIRPGKSGEPNNGLARGRPTRFRN